MSVDRKTLAKWMKRAPIACFDVSKNLQNQNRKVVINKDDVVG